MRKNNIFSLIIIIVVSAGPFFLFGCLREEKAEPQTEEQQSEIVPEPVEFTVAGTGGIETLDPHFAETSLEKHIALGLFEGLFAADPETGRGVQALAETYTVSDDGLVWTFTLRDAVWDDGTDITAEAVVGSWQRLLDPSTFSPHALFAAPYFQGGEEYALGKTGADRLGFEAVDKKTVRVNLAAPNPDFINVLTHQGLAVLPMHVVEKYGSRWTDPDFIVSGGPFRLIDKNGSAAVTLARSDTYWDRTAVALDLVHVESFPSPEEGYESYRTGGADWCDEVPKNEISSTDEEMKTKNIIIAPTTAVEYYLFQHENPPFHNDRIRKALSFSIDREALADFLNDLDEGPVAVPASGFFPSLAGRTGEKNPFNLAEAQEYLARGGYIDGVGFPSFEILFNSDKPYHKKVAEFVRDQWAANLGVRPELNEKNWLHYINMRRMGTFQIARGGWKTDVIMPSSFLELFVTGGPYNGGRFSDPEVDLIFYAEDRGPLLQKVEEILVHDKTAGIPLFFYGYADAIDMVKWVGWYPNVIDYHPFKSISSANEGSS